MTDPLPPCPYTHTLTQPAALFCPRLGTAWFLNVGDSSMMLFDGATGTPLPVWRRPGGVDEGMGICSFEDTLGSWPFAVQEGQTWRAVKRAWEAVCFHVRETRDQGTISWKLVSDRSVYGLSMINSLGNRNHAPAMLNTTTVYRMSLSGLFRAAGSDSPAPSVTLVMVSDGVKDVLNAQALGLALSSLERAVLHLLCTDADRALSPAYAARMDVGEALEALMHGTLDLTAWSAKDTLLDMIMDEGPHGVEEQAQAIIALAALLGSRDDLTCLVCTLRPEAA
jgi:hypothetical protein